MNTHSFSLFRRSSFLATAILLLAIFVPKVRAVIDDNATRQIWKLKYCVTNAQLIDNAWLALDTDGDGLSNGGEIPAGTNPFNSGSIIRITNIINGGNTVDLTFPTENGKQYVVQATPALTSAFASTAIIWTGTGLPKTLTVPKDANKFFRVLVQDIDSDADSVGNWAELAVTLNPNIAETVPEINDLTYVNAQVALPNVVTIRAAEPFASEDGPLAGKLTVSRTQSLFPITVHYNLTGTATEGSDYAALASHSLAFAARGATSQDIFVNPTVQPAVEGSKSVTATLTPAGMVDFAFTLGAPNSATVIIKDSTVASGTGLLARYYDTSNTTYAHAANFGQEGTFTYTRAGTSGNSYDGSNIVIPYTYNGIPALQVGDQVKITFNSGGLNSGTYNNLNYAVTTVNTGVSFTVGISGAGLASIGSYRGVCNFSVQTMPHPAVITRVDSTVNFDWQHGTPNGVVIAPNNSPDNYSASWETYLQPPSTGVYTFQLDADDRARVLLDTGSGLVQILEHNWTAPGSDPVGTFKLSAPITLDATTTPSKRYKIRVEHVETTGDARCRLQWRTPTANFANIPQANQFTHSQAMTYIGAAGNTAVVIATGGHSLAVGDSVKLAFSTGSLFTPGETSTQNRAYSITSVGGTSPVTVPNAVTTTGNSTVTAPGGTAGLSVGMAISGTGLPANVFIVQILSATTFRINTGTGVTAQASTTLTANATGTFTVPITPYSISVPGAATVAGSQHIIVPSVKGLAVGMAISGTVLPANEFITAISPGTGIAPSIITVTTGTGVTALASTPLTAGFGVGTTGAGFILNQDFNYTYTPTNTTSGTAEIAPVGGHALALGTSVNLAFSSGTLFNTPSSATTYNGSYTITAVFGTYPTNSYIVGISGATVPQTTGGGGGYELNNASTTTGVYNLSYPITDTSFTGSPGRVGVDGAVTTGNNGVWNSGTPDVALIAPETFSVRWTGQVQPQFSEEYTFAITADDGVTFMLNGQPQVLKMGPSSVSGTATYTYNSTTGDLVVNYTGLPVLPNSFSVDEIVRIDPTSGNLFHNPATSPTYTYDGTKLIVNYANLSNGSPNPGATRLGTSYEAGEKVELDPTSGGISVLGNFSYSVAATPLPTISTFAIDLAPTYLFNTVAINNPVTDLPPAMLMSSISTGNPCVITTSTRHGLSVGNTVAIAGVDVSVGTFAPAINATYTVTGVIAYNAFTVASNCTVAPLGNTGTVVSTVPGNVTINDTRNTVITAATATTFTVNIGPGKYANGSTGNINVDVANKTLKDWASSGNERYARVPMVAGVRYDLQLDYYESTSAARALLAWYSASQPKQIIPSERLYPSNLAANLIAKPAQTSDTEANALVNGAFSYAVGGSNGGVVTVSGNPAWLTYSGGVLSGTPPAGAAGNYQILLTITNSAGTSTSLLNLHVDENVGSVVREKWTTGVTGIGSIPPVSGTSTPSNLATLQAPTNDGDNYGARIRGYITAPVTGNYYFWIAANNAAELWIANDAESNTSFKRAWVATGSGTSQDWTVEASQKSPWLALEAGQKYYFEVLHYAASGPDDNLAIGWSKPGEATSAPSQVVPSYVLSPYTAPAPGSTPGNLYFATLLAQAGAVTNAVGRSTMRVFEDVAAPYAIVHFEYSGLSQALGNHHVHIDPYGLNGSLEALDFDPADLAATGGEDLGHSYNIGGNPARGYGYGDYKWTIPAMVGPYTRAQVLELIKQGKTYINLHTANYPLGEIRGNYTLAAGTRTFTAPPPPVAWTDDSGGTNYAPVARFLAQASFGANIADITAIKALTATGGSATAPASRYEHWIDDQFLQPPTPHLPEVLAREIGDVFGPFDVRVAFNTWWKNSISGNDQLRQRIAFALSQIHVVSGQGPLEDNSRALADFYDTLAANAFGNFRDVLIDTTLTPAMGRYLDMLRNNKPDLAIGRSPNENYAREIKQLFSIGLYRMWPDGTLMLTSNDAPIDTYTQREIVGLSHVFTGWDYGYDGADRTGFGAPADWTRPMRAVPAAHFTGPKRVLNNEVLPGLKSAGGQTLDAYSTHLNLTTTDPAYAMLPNNELNAVHDMLFNHPNTGPFICRQLIQRLVTSNPSRDYLYRVVQKFNDHGDVARYGGVRRGSMKAVIKAILLDYEARSSDMLAIPAYGKQREPLQRVANAARAFRTSTVGGMYSQTGTNLITITPASNPKLQAGNSVFLEFTDTTGDPAKPAPTAGTYTVVSALGAPTYAYTVAAPGWMAGSYIKSGATFTVTMSGHWLPGDNANVVGGAQSLPPANEGRAYFDFTTGPAINVPGFDQNLLTVVTSNSYDIPSGVGTTANPPSNVDGNYSGTSFTLPTPAIADGSGSVMISRFPGSYSCTGQGGVITIDTSYGGAGTYGQQADHGLSVGDSVFLNFMNSRDTTSGVETSKENDLTYPIASVPDPNSFTVIARNSPNAAMNSDNQVTIFPHRAQPMVRSGTVNSRQGTYSVGNTDGDLQQTPLNSPTVFNFFLPDYKFAGTLASQGITTPEFELTSETTVIRQSNYLYNGVFNPGNTTGFSSFTSGSNALIMDLSPWMIGNAANLGLGAPTNTSVPWTHNQNIDELINQFSILLTANQLSVSAKAFIKSFVALKINSIDALSPARINTVGPHYLTTGNQVVISGVSSTNAENGTFSPADPFVTSTQLYNVTVVDADTFTVVNASTLAAVNCSASPTALGLANAHVSPVVYDQGAASPNDQNRRDRLRAILHLILTSPDFTIQR